MQPEADQTMESDLFSGKEAQTVRLFCICVSSTHEKDPTSSLWPLHSFVRSVTSKDPSTSTHYQQARVCFPSTSECCCWTYFTRRGSSCQYASCFADSSSLVITFAAITPSAIHVSFPPCCLVGCWHFSRVVQLTRVDAIDETTRSSFAMNDGGRRASVNGREHAAQT